MEDALRDQSSVSANKGDGSAKLLRYSLRSATKSKDDKPPVSVVSTASVSRRGRNSSIETQSVTALDLSAKEKSAKPLRRLSTPTESTASCDNRIIQSMTSRKELRKRATPRTRGGSGSGDVPPDVGLLISKQLSAAMPNLISQISASILQNLGRNGNANRSGIEGPVPDIGGSGSCTGGSGTRNGGTVVIEDEPRGCSYKTFMGCKPQEFKGTEGAVGVLRWIEKTESVLDISECAENNKVKFATCTFQGNALTWWNTEIRTRGRGVVNAMSWDQLKEMLIAKYCPQNEIQKIETEFWELTMKEADHQGYTNRFHELSQLVPHMVTPESKRIDRYIWGLAPQIRGLVISARPNTLQSAIVLAGTFSDEMVHIGSLSKYESGNKRGRFDNKNDSRKRTNRRNERNQQSVQNYATVVSDRKQYNGPYPKCNNCNYHHVGPCLSCSKCQKRGHSLSHCKFGSCFECGSLEHFKNNCPKLKKNTENAANPPRGRAYVMGNLEA